MSTARWLRIKARAGRVLISLLVVAAAAGVFWYRHVAVDGEVTSPVGLPSEASNAEIVTRNFRHVETRMDRTTWVLEAARAEIFEEKARLRAVKITWYGEPGTIPVVITSEEGQVDFKSRNAELSGKVRIEREDGALLQTERLFWNDADKLLRAPLSVLITTPDFSFSGERLDANLATKSVIIQGRVRGEIRKGALVQPRPS